jgi:bifunctional non-homologous end joining protein LigD
MARRTTKPPRSLGLDADARFVARSTPRRPRNPLQPQLPFDPFPERIEPCLALLAASPPDGSGWIFEVKWDGYRLALHRNGKQISVLTRGGHDWSHRFPALVQALQDIDVHSIVLDGEAVVLDEHGRSDFNALQRSLGGRGGKRVAGGEVIFYAFDLLYFDGHDLTHMSLEERRHRLKGILGGGSGAIRLSEEVEADGAAFLQVACQMGLEGIIAKQRDRPYRSGRKGDWLKIKCVQRETFLVVGYEPSTKVRGAIANLLLAALKDGQPIYVGSVGTGFTYDQAVSFKMLLDSMKLSTPSIPLKRKGAVFVPPTLAAEIEFRAWTGDGKLRHASFKGMRDPEDHIEVFSLDGVENG